MQPSLILLLFINLTLGALYTNSKQVPGSSEVEVQQNVINQITSLIQTVESMKKELDSKMNALIVGVDEKVRNLATKIEQIDSGYRHQKRAVKELSEAQNKVEHQITRLLNLNNPIAFHVQRSTPFLSVPPINLEFDKVQYEIGGVWNAVTSTFIATIKGAYVFHLGIMHGTSESSARVGIMRDGNVIQQADVYYYAPSNSHYRSASASAVVELEPLAQVYCRLLEGSLFGNANHPVHFVGYLLYSLE